MSLYTAISKKLFSKDKSITALHEKLLRTTTGLESIKLVQDKDIETIGLVA